jgi:tagaturonate reductase
MKLPGLSKKILAGFKAKNLDVPGEDYFQYPERVLQFGTGVLLRGLVDYFIDKANKQGLFRGRIVVIKSTRAGDLQAFSKQDNLYTLCIRGIESGKTSEENMLNASISRVLSAHDSWKEILACAANPELQIIVSNTTEIGLVFEEDNIHNSPPGSFSGKLLAFLYERYKIFSGDSEKGFVIIPTELLPENGSILKSILIRLAHLHRLENPFIEWLEKANDFCSSLVDRIVPGKLPPKELEKTSQLLGYEDDLMIKAEIYRLWAIETSNERTKKILSFSAADPGVVVEKDIHIFRELKLRILNGSHTLSCGLGVLSGFEIVREAMADKTFFDFENRLIKQEIIPVILDKTLSKEMALEFADKVLDRYRNPYLEHKWLSITMQYSSKMKTRDLPLLVTYVEKYGGIPSLMSLGWAAHILFMKCTQAADKEYYGEYRGKRYPVNDNQALLYSEAWTNPAKVITKILGDTRLWGRDLNDLPGFSDSVSGNLKLLEIHGAKQTIEMVLALKK